MKIASHVRVFVVLVRENGEPRTYDESLPPQQARELARLLARRGLRASVVSFRVDSTQIASLQRNKSQPRREASLQVVA